MANNKMERFTQRARQVLTLAEEEAEHFEHNYIGTEHMLLGLLREEGGVAGQVLRDLKVELERVRDLVNELTRATPRNPEAVRELSSGTKRVLELAVDEARRMGHKFIGTEHLMLGLVRQSDGVAIDVLKRLGVSPEEVRRQTRRVLQEAPPLKPSAPVQPATPVSAPVAPVRTVKNQYRGINAHLHSHFQSEGGWDSFHANHIADLMRLMKAQLLPLGYTADIEQSLQIRRLGEPAGKPESDVTIYDMQPERSSLPHKPTPMMTQAVAIPQLMRVEEELAQYRAVAIYEYVQGKRDPGKPVAWVELLSPSNKPGGQDADYYRDKRLKLLQSGMVFVEIDYLHESPPTFDHFPSYGGASDAYPYHIVVVDPRPVFMEGLGYLYHIEVDDPIPVVTIPLNAGEKLEFDFGAAYTKTFEETLYGKQFVDYSQLPVNFEHYKRTDQTRILARMLAVLKADGEHVDLESGVLFPTEPLTLEDALAQIRNWQSTNR